MLYICWDDEDSQILIFFIIQKNNDKNHCKYSYFNWIFCFDKKLKEITVF